MRVLLMTLSDILPLALTQVLNPALEHCAIVVDEPEKAKKFLAGTPLENIVYPFYELKECVDNFHFDCAVSIELGIGDWGKKYGIAKNKFVNLFQIYTYENFLMERALRYYSEHAAEFEMVATGMSYTESAISPQYFKRKLFNFGRGTQDIYYDYQIAKYVLKKSGGGKIKYALIGLAPYSFHFDESKTYGENFRILQYVIALNDVHNFWLPIEKYKSLLRDDYLNFKLPLENEMNSVTPLSKEVHHISLNSRFLARDRIDVWKDRYFLETLKENVKILDDYLTLCEENNVRPIIFTAPMTYGYMKYFNKKKLDELHCVIADALRKHSAAVFFDGWRLPIFSDENFWDVDHMNIQGAAKFSAILNDFIEKLEN